MKHLLFFFVILSSICFSSLSFSEESIKPSSSASKVELKNGDCFNYTDGKVPDSEWVKGKVHHLNLGTFNLEGFLFAKKKGENGFHVFKFSMAYGKQYNYKKVKCPKSLDEYNKQNLENL